MQPAIHTQTPKAFEPRLGRSVSLARAADLLSVSRRTIYNWIRDGRLQTIRTIGGSQRVLVESVEDRDKLLTSRPGLARIRRQQDRFCESN